MKSVIVVIGPGQIGQAIARRVGIGKHIILADVRVENATAAAEVMSNAGYEVSVATVDASSVYRPVVEDWIWPVTLPCIANVALGSPFARRATTLRIFAR